MIKTLTCVDCRVVFTYDHRKGTTRQRCDTCREARRREINRAKSERHRKRDPGRAREQWARSNRKRLADPAFREMKRDYELFRTYGLTRDELDAMIAAQDGKCAICQGEPNGPGTRLHIDHCHNSKKVRGLLCGKCNTAIGLLNDDPARAESAAAYLRR